MGHKFGKSGLPSDGKIKSYIGVIDGLCNRKVLNRETARPYRQALFAKPVDRDLFKCKAVIEELDKLLEKSPSLRRGERNRSVSSYESDRDSGWYDPRAEAGPTSSATRDLDTSHYYW